LHPVRLEGLFIIVTIPFDNPRRLFVSLILSHNLFWSFASLVLDTTLGLLVVMGQRAQRALPRVDFMRVQIRRESERFVDADLDKFVDEAV